MACTEDAPNLHNEYIDKETNDKQEPNSLSQKNKDIEDIFDKKGNKVLSNDVPSFADLTETSSIYLQEKIKPAKKADALVEYLSVDNDKALISLKLLKNNEFQLQTVLLEEDIPLIIVGAYIKEGNKYYLQFADSDLCRKFFNPEVNKNPSIEMLSASELQFPISLNTINIFGIPCQLQ